MQSSPTAAVGIPFLALVVAALFVLAVARVAPTSPPKQRTRRILFVVLATGLWLTLLALLATSGLLSRLDLRPPPMAFLFVASVGMGFALGVSRIGGWLASGLPLSLLVGWHAFRLPLELVMHRAATDGLMPKVMSFSGYNFDILSGSTALVLSLVLARRSLPRAVLIAFNLLGITLLFVIAGVALLSAPFVRAFGDTEVNTWVAYFPYVWLPGVLVAGAILGHVVLTRRLWSDARAERALSERAPA